MSASRSLTARIGARSHADTTVEAGLFLILLGCAALPRFLVS
jgi:hypothetical protein